MKDTRRARTAAVIEEKGETKEEVLSSMGGQPEGTWANYEQIKEPDVGEVLRRFPGICSVTGLLDH